MQVETTRIPGVLLLHPRVFEDARGAFFASFSERDFAAAGLSVRFVQDNESTSRYGVVRGLHFQRAPFAQAKLVRVSQGRILDVAVDLRRGSPTFGCSVSAELSAENHCQMFIPQGFAHGFSVLSPEATVQYKCDAFYAPESAGGICWCDPDLVIDWGLPKEEIILSEADTRRPLLRELPESELFEYTKE